MLHARYLVIAVCVALTSSTSGLAEEASAFSLPIGVSPTVVIDALIERGWQQAAVVPSDGCDDATFLRRVSLDLIGRVPTVEERTKFLADTRSDKRQRIVDALIEHQEFAVHFADLFDGMLLGRRGTRADERRKQHGWRSYLEESFRNNRPWNQMARDMVLARSTDSSDVRGGWFLHERRNDHQAIAEVVAPNFFGIRIECAQCHDHPLASEIQQGHYWGLVAFFSRSENKNTPAGPRVLEDAVGGFLKYSDLAGDAYEAELTFFEGPTIPEKRPSEEKKEASDEDFLAVAEGSQEPRVPKFSRRERFVDEVLLPHPLLARSFVNRLWALLVGRGFVHPFDQMDSMHDASHPELLNWLAADFRQSNYDIQRLVRAIVLSKCYQLSSRPASDKALPAHFAFAITKPLAAESFLRSIYTVTELSSESNVDAGMFGEFREAFPDVLAEVPSSRVGQALMLTNEPKFNELVMRPESPLLELLLGMPSSEERVDAAFETILGRTAAGDERQSALDYLSQRDDRPAAAVAQLVWALITSAEFRVNH